jgi:acyl carrier protein
MPRLELVASLLKAGLRRRREQPEKHTHRQASYSRIMSTEQLSQPNADAIEQGVVQVINDMVADWELDQPKGIRGSTRLMEDLEFESIDIVQLAVSLEQHFEQSGLPFEKLFMRDGDYVDDLTVGEIAVFLRSHLKS